MRRPKIVGLLIAAAVLFATGSAGAVNPVAEKPGFFLQSPEERLQELRSGLVEFLNRNPDLNAEQALAIQRLADIDDPSSFATVLDQTSREVLAERLGALGKVLPYWDYLRLLRSFSDEFRVWLVENGFALAVEAATPECNCSDSQDCSGATCQNVTCIHVGGTSHNGRCPGGVEFE